MLSHDTGYFRDYGSNPYVGYDDPATQHPFLFRGAVDGRLRPMERVLALLQGGAARVWPFAALEHAGVVQI